MTDHDDQGPGPFAVRNRQIDRLTPGPGKGFNIVAVDPFEHDPEDELYLVGHYDTYEEAKAALAERLRLVPDEPAYIYGHDVRDQDRG